MICSTAGKNSSSVVALKSHSEAFLCYINITRNSRCKQAADSPDFFCRRWSHSGDGAAVVRTGAARSQTLWFARGAGVTCKQCRWCKCLYSDIQQHSAAFHEFITACVSSFRCSADFTSASDDWLDNRDEILAGQCEDVSSLSRYMTIHRLR